DLRIEFHRDGVNRIRQMPGFVEGTEYSERGHISALHLANGVHETLGYDANQRISSLQGRSPTDGVITSFGYEYDREGNVVRIIDGFDSIGFNAGGDFSYDALYRLSEARLSPSSPWAETLAYSYDRIDNIRGVDSSLGRE